MLFIAERNKNSTNCSNYGNSLFDYINPKGRNCSKYKIETKYIKHLIFLIFKSIEISYKKLK